MQTVRVRLYHLPTGGHCHAGRPHASSTLYVYYLDFSITRLCRGGAL